MSNSDLRGVISAVTTPLTQSFDVDAERLAGHCERLLNTGCSFVSTFGTTGEGASLSSQQKMVALEQLKAGGADLKRHIPSIMTPSADEAGRMIAKAASLGCRGVLVLPPFYYDAPSDEGIVAFINDAMTRAGRPDIDILLYNIPRFSRITYTPELIDRLIAKFGSAIVGLKDSTGVAANAVMLAERYPNLSIFTGDDRVMPGLVAAGGAGMIGGMPNVFCADLAKIYAAPTAPETAQLRQYAGERIAIVDSNGGMLALKAALAAIHDDPAWLRAVPPLQGLDSAQATSVLTALGKTGFVPSKAA
ncbi:dihydrodipicolinate synthase family protein [Devosia rhodophyticola]|uniref:Dihydrodipicolinate synthase family protein n=1 Tax=Devosia rhodophyticola TaxID=3026423 RepID=A0ABY7Z025_9HYPH|nr:dihydrodipicolinate synthase family protein [Devosia rhodophyticola]WDR06877.1 dihydrodipicolinate synthase family protein [Devosia rhodophyticola]